MAQLRLKSAFHHSIHLIYGIIYPTRCNFLVWRQKAISIRTGERVGTFVVDSVDYDKKYIFIWETEQEAVCLISVVQVKPFLTPEFLYDALIIDLEGGVCNFNSPDTYLIIATELLDPDDERILSREMDGKKKKELSTSMRRGIYKVVI